MDPEREEAQARLKIMRDYLAEMSQTVVALHRHDFPYMAILPISYVVHRARAIVDLCPIRIYKRDYEYVDWALTLAEQYRNQVEQMAKSLKETRVKQS
jgi:hypothetical protein